MNAPLYCLRCNHVPCRCGLLHFLPECECCHDEFNTDQMELGETTQLLCPKCRSTPDLKSDVATTL